LFQFNTKKYQNEKIKKERMKERERKLCLNDKFQIRIGRINKINDENKKQKKKKLSKIIYRKKKKQTKTTKYNKLNCFLFNTHFG
jgi:hypothetical protein